MSTATYAPPGGAAVVDAPMALKKLTFAQQLATKLTAGSIAGVVGVTSCYPVDFAKTRLQKPMPGERPFTGILDVLRTVRASQGVGGWYNGLRPNLTGIIPEKGLKLAVFDVVRDYLRGADGKVTRQGEVTAALSAAVAQVVVTTPMEIVKIRCQLTGRSMVEVVKELGLAGCYRGYCSTLLRDVTFNLCFFPLQAHLKERLIQPHHTDAQKLFYSFLGGITGGVFAAAASTPCDVIKTRLQAADGASRTSIATMATTIVREEGASALLLGLWPRVAAIAPLFGIAICVFDMQKRLLMSYGYDVPV